ncbi:BCCT family transporter [Telmatospirillum sp. J64-1]|uniref:BCCT family transporter n=1 Tax=Telmatospirillum sp. J64-1 TaxID=2502183 RepID=UPI0021026BFF|nr:BCCT family transporter [Telmatospirillum sp. J64-1]
MRANMNPPVFWGSSAVIGIFLLIGVLFPNRAEAIFSAIQTTIIDGFGWFYILSVAGFVFVILYMALSRYGQLKLGPDEAQPDYSYPSWLAMLFAAGMGIGLMFFAVAEPILHYSAPPEADPQTLEAARSAMVITFFHWGIHAWAIYAIVGLSLAYFCFRYNLPLTVRSGLYPLLKNRIYGPIGNAVDIFAICGTLFGIATSLGFGVLQINSGLNYLFGLPNESWVQVLLIAGIMFLATLSVLSGLDTGIRRLSELNLICAILLMVFVLMMGPTSFLLQAALQNVGTYLDNFFVRTFNLYAYEPRGWMSSWTLFYWAWWIAWSPFVGMFIARISRGRTVREFALGVLLIPSGFSFLWMTIFGNTAIFLDMTVAAGAITEAVSADVSVALFQFFEYLPMGGVASVLAILLVAIFFITSADSGSMVVDTIASGGTDETPVWQRIYWCSLEGFTAAVLLLAGGLSALQTVTLISALPFTVIMVLLAIGLMKGMRSDLARSQAEAQPAAAAPPTELSWHQRLGLILHTPRQQDVRHFLDSLAKPALESVAEEMRKRGLAASVERDEHDGFSLTIPAEDVRSFVYGIKPHRHLLVALSAADATRPESRRPQSWEARTYFSDGSRGYNIMGFTRDQLINDVLAQYERYQTMTQLRATALYIASPDPA